MEATSTIQPTPIWQGNLHSFATSTATISPIPPTPLPEIPLTPAPTATPFTYTVVKDDSLLGIAIKYGVSLEDLKAANPDVNARMLSIGQILIVPVIGEQETTLPATSTPVPVRLELPDCYPVADGSLACLVEVINEQEEVLENLSVWFGLYTPDGESLGNQVSVPPLNILLSGGRMPLVVYFSPPLASNLVIRVEVITALAVSDLANRYIGVETNTYEGQITTDGLASTIKGEVIFADSTGQFKAAAAVYDASGRLAGMREWKTETGCLVPTPDPTLMDATVTPAAPKPCGPIPYEITVYSLGPIIERFEIFIEAQP